MRLTTLLLTKENIRKIITPMAILCLILLGSADATTTVYVTKSGKKYHLDGCSSLSNSKVAITLQDAVKSGYTPCSICKPPEFSDSGQGRNQAALYRVNTSGLTRSSEAQVSRMVKAEVVNHVDGDTVRVRIPNPPPELKVLETIRMLGVDTPETVHPNKPVQRFGKEASAFTKERLLGKPVYLAFDWDLRDRYGRLLAYIYTEDGRCFNATLIREGFGHAYLSFPFQFIDEFKALEEDARNRKRGLWQ
jgi:micrococcal nuclease